MQSDRRGPLLLGGHTRVLIASRPAATGKHLKYTLMKRNGGSLILHCIPSVDSAMGTIMIGSPGASGPGRARSVGASRRPALTPHSAPPRSSQYQQSILYALTIDNVSFLSLLFLIHYWTIPTGIPTREVRVYSTARLYFTGILNRPPPPFHHSQK